MNAHICPSCNNEFHQQFVCTTCGAEKLNNNTIDTLIKQNETLADALLMALPFVEDCQGSSEYKRGVVANCVRAIKKALSIQ